jgi:hypothetical protein
MHHDVTIMLAKHSYAPTYILLHGRAAHYDDIATTPQQG